MGAVVVAHNRRPLLLCQGVHGGYVQVEGNIDRPEVQYILFDRSSAQDILSISLGMKTAFSVPVQDGADFTGFETFVKPYYQDDPVKMKVTRINDELTVETFFLNGSYVRSKRFQNCKNNP